MNSEIPEGCLPFDMTKALAGWPCVTRCRKEAKVVYRDQKAILAIHYYGKDMVTHWHSLNGEYADPANPERDLFLKKKTKTYNIDIFRDKENNLHGLLGNENGAYDWAYVKTISFDLEIEEEEPKPKTKKLYLAVNKVTYGPVESAYHFTTHAYVDTKGVQEAIKDIGYRLIDFDIHEIEVKCDEN
jgi:hypothetical protein